MASSFTALPGSYGGGGGGGRMIEGENQMMGLGFVIDRKTGGKGVHSYH